MRCSRATASWRFHACSRPRAGAVWCPVNPRNEAAENRQLLDAFDCAGLIFYSSYVPLVAAMRPGLPTCGAAAAIVVSEAFAHKHGLRRDVEIAGQAMRTDYASTFETNDMIRVVGFDLTREAANAAYAEGGIGPEDASVVELHDCLAQNELISYEALGLCPEGEGARFVEDGENTYGCRVVTNPAGGLLSKGHPLGATGLAQCYELTHQPRHTAGDRQVEQARIGIQHNLGLGGACVVTVYRRGTERH